MKNDVFTDIATIESIGLRRRSTAETTTCELEKIREELSSFRPCIPFIGEFSVGKSSLLNHWLGDSLLPEAQGPTTALATELRYGNERAMYVVVDNETTRKLDFLPQNEDEANASVASQGLYAFCTSPSSRLKEVSPLIPVDMPGINSGLEKHTKALYRYANKGAAFFLVFTHDQGTMPETMIAFLDELDLNGRPVWIILHKCDAAPESKIKEVASELENRCRAIGIEPRGILYTSRMDEKTPDALSKALSSLDVEALRNKTCMPAILSFISRLRNQLCALKDSYALDMTDIDGRINDCRRAKDELNQAMAKQEKQLLSSLSTLPEKTADEVYNALASKRDILINELERGKEAFATRISGIINSVLTNALQKQIEEDFHNFSEALVSHFKNSEAWTVSPEQKEILLQSADSVLNTLKGVIENVQKIEKAGKVYKFVAGALAIATEILAPIVELIIFFLPEILSFFYDKRKKLGKLLDDEVFPELREKVSNMVQEMLPELKEDMLQTMHDEWTGRITDVENALLQAQDEKKHALSEAENQKNQLSEDINTLDQMYQRLDITIKEL